MQTFLIVLAIFVGAVVVAAVTIIALAYWISGCIDV